MDTGLKLREWTHTLQFRLVIGFAASLAVCLFAVSVWATVNTRAAIDRYGERVDRFQHERARALLQDVYDFNQDFAQLQDPVHQIALLFSQRVAVVDDKGFVVADSHTFPFDPEGKLEKESDRFKKTSSLKTVPLRLGKDLSGKVIFTESLTDNRPAFRVWLDVAPPPRFRSFFGGERRLFGTAEPSDPISFDSASEVEIVVHEVDDVEESAAFFDEVVSELSIEPPLSALQDEFQKSLMISGIHWWHRGDSHHRVLYAARVCAHARVDGNGGAARQRRT